MDLVVDPDDIIKWLDETSAVLLVDELNNLAELKVKGSLEATTFEQFLKGNFLDRKNRYFIFSSHILDSLDFFSFFVDPSEGSNRRVRLQELPIVTDLSRAVERKGNLNGHREAIYYGLMPSMIYETAESRSIEGKRQEKVKAYLDVHASAEQRIDGFKEIISSLITGDLNAVPIALQILLDTSATGMIRWVPYHFEYLMQQMHSCAFPSTMEYRKFANALGGLCAQLLTAK
jgi:hypothetical protein